ncbi:MAG: lytic transglycosylase domain-containing protein, partial [Rhodospirillales bacterium]|nr:lytic transglycosylase domain-containing protein [Rhodospirillales bacterium]
MVIRSLLKSITVLVALSLFAPGLFAHANATDHVEPPLPPPLSSSDAALYQKIFSLQETGQWKRADKLVKRLGDPLLMGHVLSQRYLHPTKYRSQYKELKDWMAKYADHPRARQLYKLALRRKPARWRGPKSPYRWAIMGISGGSVKAMPKPPRKRLSSSQRRQAAQLKRRIRWHLRKGWTKAVKQTLQST